MIRFCKKCLFPDTKPDLYFNDLGVCDACDSAKKKWSDQKLIDWEERASSFNEIIDEVDKSQSYDCVVPVSGGKDSTWQVLRLKRKHGLKCLAVTFDQFDQTDIGIHNLNILREIGVDHIHFTLNPVLLKKLVLEGLKQVGDPYWVNHVGMFTIPTTIAAKFKIPLVIYGENPQFEYGGPEASRKPQPMNKRWRQEFAGLRGLREEDMIDGDVTYRDIQALKFPEDDETAGIQGLFYGDYFQWDPIEHTEEIKKLGWVELDEVPAGSYSKAENCDMQFIDLRERIKYLKYGYGRATDQLNIAIRSNNIDRKIALELVKKIDGQVSDENVAEFSRFVGIEKSELDLIIDDFVNLELFDKANNGEWIPLYERV
jgi:N-acetyl sugar amidotransferase